jgi:hypothetical protein
MHLLALAIVAIATFLLAAKSHGRQVRLERERAGYHQVVFGGSNPAFVEALWRRDRLRYWPTFALVFAAVAIARWLAVGPGGAGFSVFALGFFPFAAAFTFAGLWQLAANVSDLPSSCWLWLLVVAGDAAVGWLFFTA